MRVAGNKEGEGSKAMAMATRVASEHRETVTKRAIGMKIREEGMARAER
jgi:hypothetical protein